MLFKMVIDVVGVIVSLLKERDFAGRWSIYKYRTKHKGVFINIFSALLNYFKGFVDGLYRSLIV